MKFGLVAAAIATLSSGSAIAAPTTTFSAYGDFSTDPTGAWSYLYSDTVGGSLSNLTNPVSIDGAPGLSNGQAEPTSVSIIANTNPAPITTSNTIVIQPGTLNLDPESGTVVVRWTAPAAGVYAISGYFIGDDVNEHSPEVSVSAGQVGAVLMSTTIPSYDSVADIQFTETLAAGEFINFAVSDYGNFTDLSTGLFATITSETSAVPEPATISLFALAFSSVVAAAFRRNTPRTP